MLLLKKLRSEGEALFRWRSFVPLILLIPAALALAEGPNVARVFGESIEEYWMELCLIVSLFGQGIRCLTVGYIPTGTSGRNTHHQRADFLNTTGMYSLCRNPLYLGNFLVIFGIVLACQNLWFALVAFLAYWLYIERVIAAEEEFLSGKFGREYEEWAARTPVIFPDIRLWKQPGLVFSIKTVLKREYSGFFALFACYFVFELITDVVFETEPFTAWLHRDWIWPVLLLVGAAGFVVLRTMKKFTKVLRTDGR
jgi:protein-S-isoprenylcysteine O-methyltransferase Ste14